MQHVVHEGAVRPRRQRGLVLDGLPDTEHAAREDLAHHAAVRVLRLAEAALPVRLEDHQPRQAGRGLRAAAVPGLPRTLAPRTPFALEAVAFSMNVEIFACGGSSPIAMSFIR